MSLELEIHPVQRGILRVLLFAPEARFSELNTENISSDHFNFHVKRLVDVGLIEKTKSGSYGLTMKGKEFANRFDTDTSKVILERQAKLGVLVGCVDESSGKKRYLIQQRLKQPYYGFYGFMTGKVKWGETILETVSRELEEETGLGAKLTLVGIKHKMDYSPEGALLEDKYFFVVKAEQAQGKLVENFEGGKNIWLSGEEVLKLPDLFHGVEETIEVLNQNNLVFVERKYTVSKY